MTLISLFEKMRDYQAEQLTKDINADLPEGIRLIRDEDIDRFVEKYVELLIVGLHTDFFFEISSDTLQCYNFALCLV